jgi:hypothetical protein
VNAEHSTTSNCLCDLYFCALTPTVFVLGHFSTQKYEENGFEGPDHWHSVVSQFYDVPYIRCVAAFASWSLCKLTSLKIAPKPFYIHPILCHRRLSFCWPVPRATVFSRIRLSHMPNLKFASRGAQREAPVPLCPYLPAWSAKWLFTQLCKGAS